MVNPKEESISTKKPKPKLFTDIEQIIKSEFSGLKMRFGYEDKALEAAALAGIKIAKKASLGFKAKYNLNSGFGAGIQFEWRF